MHKIRFHLIFLKVLSQYGSQTNTTSGHFNHPRICDADYHGNLMVVDSDNHKIKVIA